MTDDILNLDSPSLIIYKYARVELNLVQVTMCAHSCLCNTIIQVCMGVSSLLTFLPRNWTGWAAAGGSLKEVAAVWRRRRNDGERAVELLLARSPHSCTSQADRQRHTGGCSL